MRLLRTGACSLLALAIAAAPPPNRVNQAIEMLAQGQPIYYTGGHEGMAAGAAFETGQKMAGTWADYINFDMEHAPFDVSSLAAFMKGLVKGGPSRSGHRTPAVIVTLPTDASDAVTMRANAWMVKQVLATGIHGILLCHADDPAAVKVFVEAARFPVHHEGVGAGLEEGRRGIHGVPTAAAIWGLSQKEYIEKADPLAAQPEWRDHARLEDRGQACARARGREPLGPGHLLRGMGTRRHGAFPRHPGRHDRRSSDARRSGDRAGRLQEAQDFFPEHRSPE